MDAPINYPNSIPTLRFSGQSEWAFKTYYEQNLQGAYLNDLPYEIRYKIGKKIEKQWSLWEPKIKEFFEQQNLDLRGVNTGSFLAYLCHPISNHTVNNLLEIAHKINDPSILRYLDCSKEEAEKLIDLESKRHRADRNFSKGLMTQITSSEIDFLEGLLWDSKCWKRVADGLGFDGQMCANTPSPNELLSKLRIQYPETTIERFLLETERLEIFPISTFVKHLNYGIITNAPCLINPLLSIVTRFDMQRLDEIFAEYNLKINWKEIAEQFFSDVDYPLEKNLWHTGTIVLLELFDILKKADKNSIFCVQKFEKELLEGSYEQISPGGITYAQVVSISNMIDKYIDKNITCLSHRYRLHELFNKITISHQSHTIDIILNIFWQSNPEMSLTHFYSNISKSIEQSLPKLASKIIRHGKQLSLPFSLKRFEILFSKKIAPYNNNSKINSDDTIKKISHKALIEPLDPNICSICFDRKINAVLIPCGHLGFCLECLKDINKCPSCRTDIFDRIKVYRC